MFAASADFLTTGLGWIVGDIKERKTLEPNTLLVGLSIIDHAAFSLFTVHIHYYSLCAFLRVSISVNIVYILASYNILFHFPCSIHLHTSGGL